LGLVTRLDDAERNDAFVCYSKIGAERRWNGGYKWIRATGPPQ
jgi:hypothetical protein